MVRVLICDDQIISRQLFEMIVNGSENYELVKSLESAKVADIYCSGGNVDLILMDVQMPIMNGYEATRRIREMKDPAIANITILAMTANAFEEDRQAAIAAGMNDHLTKPVDVKKLKDTLVKYLG